ncbi:DNA helicase UvrD [Candidatus Bathyarchaeota archaeon]|nr:DNA helicase UvrD [Candidatus Bathyarchaeota archaeon]
MYSDLHIHSSFSHAASKEVNINNLEVYAKLKGVNLLGTGDFTHPKWLIELKKNLSEVNGEGIFQTKKSELSFLLSTEVCNIYEFDNRVRRVHNLILARNFEIVDQINEQLKKFGDLEADGRPVFNGVSCTELVNSLMSISKDILIIPAHYFTPWFGVLGSKSGFNSVEECFQEESGHIYALETGLSSDPLMAFRISKLDKYTLVSFSDSHTYIPLRLGREFTAFKLNKLSFKEIYEAIKNKDKSKLVMTGEFFPEVGKYHFSGHRKCNVNLHPKDAMKFNNICPNCKRKLTIGVLQRVEELADRPEGFMPNDYIPFKHLVPLMEIIAEIYNVNAYSQTVWSEYHNLIEKFGNELNILLNVPKEELIKVANEKLVEAIIKVREGKIKYIGGYDGVYGRIIFFNNEEKREKKLVQIQKNLEDFLK